MSLSVPPGAASARISARARSGLRRVVDDAERVDEVVLLAVEGRGQLLGVRLEEPDPVADAHHLCALRGDAERLAREVDGRELGAGTGEVDRVGADAAADLEHALAAPALELGEAGMCGSTRYFRASTSSKYSRDPTGFGECRMLQGRASQYRWTSSRDAGAEL